MVIKHGVVLVLVWVVEETEMIADKMEDFNDPITMMDTVAEREEVEEEVPVVVGLSEVIVEETAEGLGVDTRIVVQ